jgi:hypothetical protein
MMIALDDLVAALELFVVLILNTQRLPMYRRGLVGVGLSPRRPSPTAGILPFSVNVTRCQRGWFRCAAGVQLSTSWPARAADHARPVISLTDSGARCQRAFVVALECRRVGLQSAWRECGRRRPLPAACSRRDAFRADDRCGLACSTGRAPAGFFAAGQFPARSRPAGLLPPASGFVGFARRLELISPLSSPAASASAGHKIQTWGSGRVDLRLLNTG